MFDVLVIGSTNLDLVVTTARHPRPGETVTGDGYAEYPGGKGLNQAVAAARAGASTALIGAVGNDAAGRVLSRVAAEEGIDIERLATIDDLPSGRALITVDARGENSIVVVAGANGAIESTTLPHCRVVLAQLEIPLDAVSATFIEARGRGVTTILNPAPARPLPDSLLAACDVVVPNEHEVELLGGVEHLLDLGVGAVIVTLGAAGAAVHRVGTDQVDVPAIATEVVDTTGAGDAFCGNLAARLAVGDQLDDAVRWAVAAGGLAVRSKGAVPSLPFAADVAAFRRDHTD